MTLDDVATPKVS